MPGTTSPLQRQARNRYQRGMLAWLQLPGDPAGLPEMRQAVRQLETVAQGDFPHFWRIAEVFLRAISDGTLAVDAEAKRLCARLDLQMRAALHGADSPDSRLADELQQAVRKGAAQGPATAEFISLLPQEEAPALDPDAVAAWSAAGQALIRGWDLRATDGPALFRRALTDLCAAALGLELPETLHLAEALASVGEQLDTPHTDLSPHLRAAVAAALELLADPKDLGLSVFAQRVDHVTRRLETCRDPHRPAISPVLLGLFASELSEQVECMREELARLEPDAQVLRDAALALAEPASHLELAFTQTLIQAFVDALSRVERGPGFDHPQVREILEAALAEMDTMADYLAAALPLPVDGEILDLLQSL